MSSSASNKAKLFAKKFCENSSLDDSGISLPVFISRINVKLHNIFVTPKMVKRIITNLDSSKALCPESLHKNIQLMLVFLKAPFLVLHFSYYTLTTFLTMFSVNLLSMLIIPISILSVIRHLICGNN